MRSARFTVAIGAVLAASLSLAAPATADDPGVVGNNPPTANPDEASVAGGATAMVDVLANDSDPDGDALTLAEAYLPVPEAGSARALHGKVEIVATAGFVGAVTITYRVEDGRGGASNGQLTVSITEPAPSVSPTPTPSATPAPIVTPSPSPSPPQPSETPTKQRNRKPAAAADAASVTAGESVTVDVLANDSDPDGDTLAIAAVGKPKHGKARRNEGRIKYTPKARFVGTDRFSYTVKDKHGARSRATVTITVIARPEAEPSTPPPPSPGGKVTRTDVERALDRLGLPVGSVNGNYDARTRRAVCAWRTVAGRSANRRLPSAAEARAIVAMDGLPPALGSMVAGLNISKTCQAAFWVSSANNYRAIMPATTGKRGYATRSGVHRVFLDYHTWRRSTIYTTAWMYHPKQFSGGQAVHGSATDRLVKTYPASHGCVRMLHRDIDRLEDGGFGMGSLVRVFGAW